MHFGQKLNNAVFHNKEKFVRKKIKSIQKWIMVKNYVALYWVSMNIKNIESLKEVFT